tara:strand:- start:406 stop:600 length:195 start_codon:yes stop_codon:yes gene_type:complete
MISTGNAILLYIISFFVPIVGFILGGIYLINEDEDVRKIGENLIAIPIAGFIVVVILIFALLAG